MDRNRSRRTCVFGIISGARAWRCRLDVDGNSSIGIAEIGNLDYAISSDRMWAFLTKSDDPAAAAAAIVAEWVRLYRGPKLPSNFAEIANPFICQWIRDIAKLSQAQLSQAQFPQAQLPQALLPQAPLPQASTPENLRVLKQPRPDKTDLI